MTISKLIDLLKPYAELDAVVLQWDYNAQEDRRYDVSGIQVTVKDNGPYDVLIMIEVDPAQ
jgi:hypothetical protein